MSKQKTEEFPSMERPKIKEIENAAAGYVSIRDKRMTMTEKEVASKINLIQVLMDHISELETNADGNKEYRFDDLRVILSSGKPGVKVKSLNDSADDGEE